MIPQGSSQWWKDILKTNWDAKGSEEWLSKGFTRKTWQLKWRRELKQNELEWAAILDQWLKPIALQRNVDDLWWWKHGNKGHYSIKSVMDLLYSQIDDERMEFSK
ncbi:hypothetical protein Ancab_008586, partial [Ancistrocladus abbreviatus]